MAGVVPKRSASGRKQWTIQESQRSSLKLLRNQLANDGCSESQVVLAKQLLDSEKKYQSASEKKENERLGVYWLIKASQQGNVEATELLRACLKTGKGISEYNFLDVKSCITMTQDEKLTRKAAREIFASLSNGGDYITTEQLRKKILSIEKNKESKMNEPSEILENGDVWNSELAKNKEDSDDSDSDTDWTSRSDSTACCSEKLTEDHLVTAAEDYSHGHLPLVTKSLYLTPPNLNSLDSIPYVYRSILHPWLVLKIVYYKMLKFLGKTFNPFNLKSELQFLILLSTYSFFFNSDNILYIIPVVIYYITFMIMAISTCRMLQSRRDFSDFRLWSGLFLCYSAGNLNAEQAEYQYVRNNLKSYGHFFLALMVNLMMYSIISEQWVPDSELTILSFILTVVSLVGFMPRKNSTSFSMDPTILLSFAVNVLAKYPYETDPVVSQVWRFLDLKLPTFTSYVLGDGIEFCLNFRLALYIAIPALFIQIASKNNWKSTYRTLIPHCVTLSWLQICIISSQGATMYGLLRGVVASIGVILLLPLVGLTSVIIPAVTFTKWVISSNLTFSVIVFAIVSSVAFSISWLLARTRFRNYTAIVQVVVMILSFFALINSTRNRNLQLYSSPQQQKYLDWESFQKFCQKPAWQDENMALAQIKCSELDGSLVDWEGYIKEIRIKSVKNNYKRFLQKLPDNIFDFISCYLGEEITDSVCENLPDNSQEHCRMFYHTRKISNTCSLERFNEYIFELMIRMNFGIWGKGPEITLVVEHFFKNFTMKLKPGDNIWFKGHLFNNENVGSDGILGGLKPHVVLHEIGCQNCHDSELTELKIPKDDSFNIYVIIQYLYVGIKFVLNVLFNPVVIFK